MLRQPTLPAPADATVLLVLLPAAPRPLDAAISQALGALQQRLAPAVRVLTIDSASHPVVVRSFGTPALPACVLMRQGVELWRQQGLPDGDAVAELLLVGGGVAR